MSLYCEIQFEDEKRGYFYESENPLEVLNWVKEKVTRYEYKDYDVMFDRFFYGVNADGEDAKDRGCINFILRKKEEISKREPERKKLYHMTIVVPKCMAKGNSTEYYVGVFDDHMKAIATACTVKQALHDEYGYDVGELHWRTQIFYLNENNYEANKKDLPFD